MKIPKVIKMIYDDLSQIAATTVITPDVEEWIYRRYGKLNTYLNQDYHFLIAYPQHCTVDNALDRHSTAIYPAHCLLGMTLLLAEPSAEIPVLNLTVEKTLCRDSIDAFNRHLDRLKGAGFSCNYRSDDQLNIATLSMSRMDHQGEPLYSIQKYIIHSEYLYLITLGEIKPRQLDKLAALNGEIKQIIGSFSFINK